MMVSVQVGHFSDVLGMCMQAEVLLRTSHEA